VGGHAATKFKARAFRQQACPLQKQTYALQQAMSCVATGHVRFKPNSDAAMVMSALHLKADMCGALGHVCFGPIVDIISAPPLQQKTPGHFRPRVLCPQLQRLSSGEFDTRLCHRPPDDFAWSDRMAAIKRQTQTVRKVDGVCYLHARTGVGHIPHSAIDP
jgi:hypothetical protein